MAKSTRIEYSQNDLVKALVKYACIDAFKLENSENLAYDFDKNQKFIRGYMGGVGSGNWYRSNSKTLAEHCMSIDVRQLNRKGCLKPCQRYSWQWQNGCIIDIETKPEAIELLYAISNNGQRDDVHIEVPLSWTSCNYGGKRPWFICPGKGCGRRVAKLYLAGKYFLCRRCHDLVYSSQRERKEFRLLNRVQRICQKLGSNNYDDLRFEPGPKPKGMHQVTYDELIEKAQDLKCEAMRTMIKNFKPI